MHPPDSVQGLIKLLNDYQNRIMDLEQRREQDLQRIRDLEKKVQTLEVFKESVNLFISTKSV